MRLWIVALAAGILATPALAQAPPEEAPLPPAEEQEAEDVGESILEEALGEYPDGYTYDSQGRRDPFVSLNRRIEGGERGPRPAGIDIFGHCATLPLRTSLSACAAVRISSSHQYRSCTFRSVAHVSIAKMCNAISNPTTTHLSANKRLMS